MIKYDFKTYNRLELSDYSHLVSSIDMKLNNKDLMTGWYNIDNCISTNELEKLKNISNNIRNNYDVLIVIGIGGSYLGAKAIIDALSPYFKKNNKEVLFAGNSLSSEYHAELLNYINDKSFVINVVSKSGETIEPSIAFDLLYDLLKNKYGIEEANRRIVITTDEETGTLRKFANENNITSLIIPSNIGGRFSVLTSAGLLPIAVSGIDIDKLLSGARKVSKDKAYEYAFIRQAMYEDSKILESFTVYEPKLLYFTEWLKQLFAESQGKDYKGIMPISAVNTRDLHSLGQYYQEGSRIIFETVINIKNSNNLHINKYNKSLQEINDIALNSVASAHLLDNTYSNIIELDYLNEENLGELIYFFELTAAIGGYLLDVNPFNQPGVNKYKDIMKEYLEVKND